MTIIERVQIRLPESEKAITEEFIQTITDRLCIRLNEEILPETFQSVCVDAVVKMYRRIYYEGITSEGAANISTSFVDDILSEYMQEITDWKERKVNTAGSGRAVRFL